MSWSAPSDDLSAANERTRLAITRLRLGSGNFAWGLSAELMASAGIAQLALVDRFTAPPKQRLLLDRLQPTVVPAACFR